MFIIPQVEKFQSAPPPSRAGRQGHEVPKAKVFPFHPRPAQSSGSTWTPSLLRSHSPVSIRAPPVEWGDPILAWSLEQLAQFQSASRPVERGDVEPTATAKEQQQFQSAPRSVERGDVFRGLQRIRSILFQSAPRSVERGDPAYPGAKRGPREVSIRAPLSRAGRLPVIEIERDVETFQSAPRSVERGDRNQAPSGADR